MATPAAAPTPSQPAPHRSRLGARAARRHNPLWRRTDTLRGRLRVLLAITLATTAALSALLALGLYHDDRASALRYAATLHRTTAVALTDADQNHGGFGAGSTAVLSWTSPSGSRHQARAATAASTLTGDKVTVWLTRADQVVAPPTSVADSTGRAILLGSLTLLGSGTLVLAGGTLARSRLSRADLRNWELDWQHTEPTWTRRK